MKKLIALVAALVMVSSFAYAADWNFYGSARVSTFWNTIDTDTPGVADVDNFAEALQGNSRIGANVKVSDELTGRFEYGTGVNVRILWGEWNFGSGSFGVGQHYTPLNLFYSNQVYGADTDLLNTGGVYSGRNPMLRLKFGGFQIAAVAPSTAGVTTGNVDGAVTATVAAGGAVTYAANLETDDWSTVENAYPALEAKYTFKMDAFTASFAAGYQTYEVKTAAGLSADNDTYVLALGGSYNFGIAYVKADYFMGQNVGEMIWTAPAATAIGTATGLQDTDTNGYLVVLGGKINDMFAVEGGYGYASSDFDVAGMADDDVSSYYVQSTITLAPGVMVIPEFGVIDNEEANTTKNTYFGAKWQINF